jgi:hypothetical protein
MAVMIWGGSGKVAANIAASSVPDCALANER